MHHGSELLGAWIERSKFNQHQTAELLGISDVYVSQLLNRQRTPALEVAVRIEQRTGVPAASWLFDSASGAQEPVAVSGTKRKQAVG